MVRYLIAQFCAWRSRAPFTLVLQPFLGSRPILSVYSIETMAAYKPGQDEPKSRGI